jgi:hypothetical protein
MSETRRGVSVPPDVSEREIVISHVIGAPPELLFEAFSPAAVTLADEQVHHTLGGGSTSRRARSQPRV